MFGTVNKGKLLINNQREAMKETTKERSSEIKWVMLSVMQKEMIQQLSHWGCMCESGKQVVQKLGNDHFIHRNCCPLQSQVNESWRFGQRIEIPKNLSKTSGSVKVKNEEMKHKTLAVEFTFRLAHLKLEKTLGNSAKSFLSPTELCCKENSTHRSA